MRILVALGAAALVAACGPRPVDVVVPVGPVDWRTDLAAQNNSGIQGAAVARSNVGSTGTSVTIWGARSGDRHPWHIHSGTCATGGPIVGDPGAYPPLAVGTNGNASASAQVNVQLATGASYHVNVHRSTTDLGTIVACGNLRT